MPTVSDASGGVYIILGSVLVVVVLIFGVMAIFITIFVVLIKKGMYNNTLITLDGTIINNRYSVSKKG